MKILTINWTYKYGSTGKIILDIENELSNCNFLHCVEYKTLDVAENVYVLTGWIACRVYNRMTKVKGLQYENGWWPTTKLIRKIERFRPDIVHIHCPNGHTLNLYRLLNFLKKSGIPTVITNHAEFFYTGNCPHAFECTQYLSGCKQCDNYHTATNSLIWNRAPVAWNKMYGAFSNFERLEMVCVSDWQAKRLQNSKICSGIKCSVIYNGVDTDTFKAGVYDRQRKERIVLFVTASFSDDRKDPKGGKYVIELAKKLEQNYPDIRFWVVGPDRTSGEMLPPNMKSLGEITDQKELAEIYAKADLTIIASKRETFGMACVESMCCGTPVVGFENGGTESIALKEYSRFVPYNDMQALENVIIEWVYKKMHLNIEQFCSIAQEKYSKRTMAQKYYELYRQMLSLEGEENDAD